MSNIPERIFILLQGESEDGRGVPDFYKRTLDEEEAKAFYCQERKNPYSFSQVWLLTPTSMETVDFDGCPESIYEDDDEEDDDDDWDEECYLDRQSFYKSF